MTKRIATLELMMMNPPQEREKILMSLKTESNGNGLDTGFISDCLYKSERHIIYMNRLQLQELRNFCEEALEANPE